MKKLILSATACIFLLVSCKTKQVEQIEQNRTTQISDIKADVREDVREVKAFRKKRNATLEKDWHQSMQKAKKDIKDATQKLETAKANHDKEAEKIAQNAYTEAQKTFDEAVLLRKRHNTKLENAWHKDMRKAKVDLQRATQKLEAAKANHDKEAEKTAQIAYEDAQKTFDEAVALRNEHNAEVESDLQNATKRAEKRFYKIESKLAEAKISQNKEAEKIAQESYNKAIKDLEEARATTTKLINESDARLKNLTNKK